MHKEELWYEEETLVCVFVVSVSNVTCQILASPEVPSLKAQSYHTQFSLPRGFCATGELGASRFHCQARWAPVTEAAST